MDTTAPRQHQPAHDDDDSASNQRECAPSETSPAQTAIVAQFLAHFDPLARLEAEYAAVLAQSSSSAKHEHEDAGSSSRNQKQRDSDSDSDDDDDGTYARVPMSPGSDGGEFYQPLGDASDSDDGLADADDDEEELQASSSGVDAEATPALKPMDAATREAIMKSMQRMTLAPPPWAASAKLTDDELFAMVRDRLER